MFPDSGKNKKTVTVSTPDDKNTKGTDDTNNSDSLNLGSGLDELKLNNPSPSNSSNQDLADIKRKALREVSELINALEQPPEQLFRTMMMIIQETDNSNLLSQAYNTAVRIQDEKIRAEALLTIANEINYFTNKQSQKF